MKYVGLVFLAANVVWSADVTLRLSNLQEVPLPVVFPATAQASRMFAAIGIRLEWQTERSHTPAGGAVIQVKFATRTLGHPDALAFSNPFDTVPVVTVLYSHILAITETSPELRTALLAHALVHEIGHLLMKSDMHSPAGVMKAHWSNTDYPRMAHRPIPFLPDDVDRIRDGLKLMYAGR